MKKMKIEIWSDIACPYCYIGKRKLELALERFPHADQVELEWHSYELNSSLPKSALGKSIYEYMVEHHGIDIEAAKANTSTITSIAKSVGLDYNFDKLIVTNTSDALRLVKLAKEHKLADEAEEVLFKAYFIDGKNISDRKTLLELGTGIGLSESEITKVLDSDKYLDEINQDIRYSEDTLALEYIPFYLFNNKEIIQGSLEVEEYFEILNKSFEDWSKNGVSQSKGDRISGKACSIDGTCSI